MRKTLPIIATNGSDVGLEPYTARSAFGGSSFPGRLDASGDVLRVSIIDLSGETNVAYTPLAAMYLKASILDHADLAARTQVKLHYFLQRDTPSDMLEAIVADHPHVIGFSCQGWNFRQFIHLFSPIKQFLPDAMLVLGGNHVTHRGEELLRIHSDVDVVVSGEGELAMRELLHALLEGLPLDGVPGLSFRRESAVVTTNYRPLSRELDRFPSPYSLQDLDLRQFDVALLETNRGCPYMCGFCYWGGRIGQKLAIGSIERVRDELGAIARAGIETVFLCDANFGLLEQDLAVAELVVEMHKRYGSPREFHVNWAKNNASRVGEVIRILRDGGLRTTINVPLQTLDPNALKLAGRGETGRKAMVDLAMQMVREGSELYCELIFGMPGESFASFKQNYDRLFLQFPNLRIHPLWILPNTAYEKQRRLHGIKTISPDPTSDYEAVLLHNDISREEMRDGLSMLLAHSMLNLLGAARDPLRLLAVADGRSAAEMLCDFEPFLAARTDELSVELHGLFERIRRTAYFERALRDRKRQLLYRNPVETLQLISEFLLAQRIPDAIRSACLELARYNSTLLPRGELAGDGFVETEALYCINVCELASRLARRDADWPQWLAASGPTRVVVRHKAGLAKLRGSNCDLTGSWNGRVVSVQATATTQRSGNAN